MQYMRNKRQKNGHGNRAIDKFIKAISILEKGDADVNYFTDESMEGDRLQSPNVEKQAAVILCNPPVMYSVKTLAKSKHAMSIESIRLSIGFSLSVGVPYFQRFTVTIPFKSKSVIVVEAGAHLMIPEDAEVKYLRTIPDKVKNKESVFIGGIKDALEEYQEQQEVQSALRKIGERRKTELNYLEQLYARGRASKARLYGFADLGIEGSASIDAEHRRLQEIVLTRYTPVVRIRLLSLGVFYTKKNATQ